nr:hypothetical protein [Streptomyces clavuligerus]
MVPERLDDNACPQTSTSGRTPWFLTPRAGRVPRGRRGAERERHGSFFFFFFFFFFSS